jgi:hypothetical protein
VNASGPKTKDGEQTEASRLARLPPLTWWFIALALLLPPLFAHGCHGDDVDHEPLLIPSRLNSEDR